MEKQLSRSVIGGLDIPKPVAESAVKGPLGKHDPRQPCADALFESVYGNKAEARGKTLTDLDERREANRKAQEYSEKLAKDQTATKKQKDDAFKAWIKAYADYNETKNDYVALRKNLTVPQVLLGFGENAAPVLRWLDAADSLPSQV